LDDLEEDQRLTLRNERAGHRVGYEEGGGLKLLHGRLVLAEDTEKPADAVQQVQADPGCG